MIQNTYYCTFAHSPPLGSPLLLYLLKFVLPPHNRERERREKRKFRNTQQKVITKQHTTDNTDLLFYHCRYK